MPAGPLTVNPQRAYEFGPFRVDTGARRLWRHGHPVALSTQGCDLLLALLERSPDVVERETIERRVWPDTFVSPESLRIAIHRLRRTLDDEGESPRYVEVVAKQGYRFRPPVSVLDGPGAVTRTIAILPFENDDADQDEMIEGIADALVTRLHRLRHLVVRPPGTTAAAVKARGGRDIGAIGEKLKVDLILDGRLQIKGEAMRLAVSLVSVADRRVIWASRFDASTRDPFAFEDSVSAAVADALALKLTPSEGRILRKRDTNNVEARRSYARGIHLLEARTPESIRKAGDAFELAAQQDPGYAAVWVGRAEVATLSVYYLDRPAGECMPQASAFAHRALELDEDLAPAYVVLAHVAMRYEWDFAGAERLFRRAIELSPAYPTAHHWFSHLLAAMNRHDEALAENEIAQEIDPLSHVYCATRVWLLFMAGRPEEAVRHYHDFEEILTRHAAGRLFFGWALALQGELAGAEEAFRALQKLGGGPLALASIGYVLAKTGRRAEALAIRDEIRDLGRSRYIQPDVELLVNLGLEDDDASLSCLERGCEERSFNIFLIGAHPMFARLRTHPRFQALLRRIGLDSALRQ